jgi:hypothetical protein
MAAFQGNVHIWASNTCALVVRSNTRNQISVCMTVAKYLFACFLLFFFNDRPLGKVMNESFHLYNNCTLF